MRFELGFLDEALKEWRKLNSGIHAQFKAKLAAQLLHPRVPSAQLSIHAHRYKIKLRSVGYRLVYEVRDSQLIVVVVAVGRPDRNAGYKAAEIR